MGKQSKAAAARLHNLQKAENVKKATVENASDDEDSDYQADDLLEQGFFFLDEDISSDDEDEVTGDENNDEINAEELEDLRNEADIEQFNAILFEARSGMGKP